MSLSLCASSLVLYTGNAAVSNVSWSSVTTLLLLHKLYISLSQFILVTLWVVVDCVLRLCNNYSTVLIPCVIMINLIYLWKWCASFSSNSCCLTVGFKCLLLSINWMTCSSCIYLLDIYRFLSGILFSFACKYSNNSLQMSIYIVCK